MEEKVAEHHTWTVCKRHKDKNVFAVSSQDALQRLLAVANPEDLG